MSKLQKEDIRAAVINYCKVKDISRNELATRIGVSSATISKIVNEKWENIDNKLWLQIENYVRLDHLNDVYQTRDLNSVFMMCDNARKYKQMIGLTADTGMGKTTAISAYGMRQNVYYYYIDGTVTPRVFLRDLLREIGVSFEGSINAMLQRIAAELNIQDAPLVILDECGKMSDKMMLIIHSLRDKTMKSCGYVLAGMPDFKDRLIKQVNKGTAGYGEFFRRVNLWHELKGLNTEEINHVLMSNGITSPEEQKEFKKMRRFGDLQNEINLHKTLLTD